MCGIYGVVGSRFSGRLEQRLASMRSALRHRGPDGEGLSIFKTGQGDVALGHVRLSIIAPTTGGQPMRDESGRFCLIFNGAIYNFVALRDQLLRLGQQFSTASDTEVLLKAYLQWGPACLARLEGMYAFAIWDALSNSVFLARDRFGEKPLFYSLDDGELVFASDIHAVVAALPSAADIDPKAVADYLMFKYVPGARTMFQGVVQLPPGCEAVFDDGKLTVRPSPRTADSNAIGEAAEPTPAGLRKALGASVRLRLQADVPVGVFLSGGVDSAAIASLAAAEASSPPACFTADIVGGDPSFSERGQAAEIAAALGLPHHVVSIGPDSFVDGIELATCRRGAPLSEFNDIAFLRLAELAGRHVKVVLCGEGADELFAGYPRYWGEALVARLQAGLPEPVLEFGLAAARTLLGADPRRSVFLQAAAQRAFVARQAAWFGGMPAPVARRIAPGLFADYDPLSAVASAETADDPVQAAMAFDRFVWLPDNLLARGDRMTMAAPIEMRLPYLDSDVVAIANALPTKSVLRGRAGKLALRQAVADLLPASVATRRKHGFKVPFGDWSRGTLKTFVTDRLLAPDLACAAFVDRAAVRDIVEMHLSGQQNLDKQLWAFLALETFLRGDHASSAPQ